jgi:hypothetical protein
MARLVPAIHVFYIKQDVDARDKRGHDTGESGAVLPDDGIAPWH